MSVTFTVRLSDMGVRFKRGLLIQNELMTPCFIDTMFQNETRVQYLLAWTLVSK